MENRHSSPSRRAASLRPSTYRKRSNSLPMVDALGCSTPEAELILAEGRAAVRSRHASRRGQGRRNRSDNDEATTFRPQDHLNHLDVHREPAAAVEEPVSADQIPVLHGRTSSNFTDRSGSTITGPTASAEVPQSPPSPGSPLGDYSANLAKFIKSQLNSIPAYHSNVYPPSCPDLSLQARTPPQSPTKTDRPPVDVPGILEMPPVRPPLRSAFSAWSSTDDETEAEAEDELPPLPSMEPGKESKASNYTPSILRYYENSSESSFLFTSTPPEEAGAEHPNADGFSFPNHSPPASTSTSESHSATGDKDYPSSTLSSHPQLTSSSAPSFSSTSTASYFDCKRPISIAPHIRDRIVAAVSPHHGIGKVLTAISPFEGGALASVHDIYVESQKRVLVDGLSFDLVRNFNLPDDSMRALSRVPTPC